MELRSLGRSGLSVSAFALGTMTFGTETADADAERQLDIFVEAGGTLVDTADVYGGGRAEETIGRWLSADPGRRDSVVIASKAGFPAGSGRNDDGLSRRHLRRALEGSLMRLGVDHIDLYQLHRWDSSTPLEESLGFLEDAVRAGKIGYVGVSNFIGWQIARSVSLAAPLAIPVSAQVQYNLLIRDIEWEIAEVCEADGVGILAWSPLAGGWLTGKYHRDARPEPGSRLGTAVPGWSAAMAAAARRGPEAFDRQGSLDQTWDVLDALAEVSEALGATQAHVATSWLLSRPAVTSVVVGARTSEQLAANLAGADLRLPAELAVRLDTASAPCMGDYPYGPRGVATRRS